jgi:hypothetical protein
MSLICKASLIVHFVDLAVSVINISINTSQVGRGKNDPVKYTTPDGGTMTLPDKAMIEPFGDDKFINDRELNIAPGAVRAFTYKKERYIATFDANNGKFLGYKSTSNPAHRLSKTENTLPAWKVSASGKRLKQAGGTLSIALFDGPEPGPADVIAGVGALALTISAIWATENLTKLVTTLTAGTGAYEGYLYAEGEKTLNDL